MKNKKIPYRKLELKKIVIAKLSMRDLKAINGGGGLQVQHTPAPVPRDTDFGCVTGMQTCGSESGIC